MAIFASFSLGNIGHENVFQDIQKRESAFLGYKNNNFENTKNCYFFKGLNHGFSQKKAIFPLFVF